MILEHVYRTYDTLQFLEYLQKNFGTLCRTHVHEKKIHCTCLYADHKHVAVFKFDDEICVSTCCCVYQSVYLLRF